MVAPSLVTVTSYTQLNSKGSYANVIDEHFIQTNGSKGRLDDICNGLRREDSISTTTTRATILIADILIRDFASPKEERPSAARLLAEDLRHSRVLRRWWKAGEFSWSTEIS
jgi:hypothetical protein